MEGPLLLRLDFPAPLPFRRVMLLVGLRLAWVLGEDLTEPEVSAAGAVALLGAVLEGIAEDDQLTKEST